MKNSTAFIGLSVLTGAIASYFSFKQEYGPIPFSVISSDGCVPILMYHHVGEAGGRYTVSPASLKEQLSFLDEKGYTTISAADYVSGAYKERIGQYRKPVLLTFDDATQDQLFWGERSGYPSPLSAVGILNTFAKEHATFGRHAVFFVDSAQEPSSSRDSSLYEAPFGSDKSFRSKLRYLKANGYEVGSHSMNHRSFEDISLAQAREELDSIDAILGTSSFFAYPYGRTPLNVDVINYVAQRFKGVFICENNIAQDPSSPSFDGSHIPRIEMNEHGLYKLSLIDWVVSGNEACAEDHMKKQAPSQRLIILDPGHGGKKNKGTQLLEITEDEITYDIVARIMEILEKDGYNSVQTLYDSVTKNIPRDTLHNDDNEGILLPSGKTTAITGYGNMQRAEVMNAWDMKRHEDPIVVSVHVNASSSYLCGAAFYYPDALKYGSLETERASLELVDFLKAEFSQSEVPTYSLCLGDTRIDGVVEDERTKTANETLTIFSNTPDIATKVLIETANAANPNDAVRVLSPQGRQDIAVAVAKGIESYLKEHPMK